MAKDANKNEEAQASATTEVKDVNGKPADGVVSRVSVGDGLELVTATNGQTSVLPAGEDNAAAENLSPEQHQKAVDVALENSRPGKDDPRHSEHKDFSAADNAPVNKDAK